MKTSTAIRDAEFLGVPEAERDAARDRETAASAMIPSGIDGLVGSPTLDQLRNAIFDR